MNMTDPTIAKLDLQNSDFHNYYPKALPGDPGLPESLLRDTEQTISKIQRDLGDHDAYYDYWSSMGCVDTIVSRYHPIVTYLTATQLLGSYGVVKSNLSRSQLAQNISQYVNDPTYLLRKACDLVEASFQSIRPHKAAELYSKANDLRFSILDSSNHQQTLFNEFQADIATRYLSNPDNREPFLNKLGQLTARATYGRPSFCTHGSIDAILSAIKASGTDINMPLSYKGAKSTAWTVFPSSLIQDVAKLIKHSKDNEPQVLKLMALIARSGVDISAGTPSPSQVARLVMPPSVVNTFEHESFLHTSREQIESSVQPHADLDAGIENMPTIEDDAAILDQFRI